MSRQQSIGLLGGTFDPVHAGHLALAEAALDQCCLETVLCIPAAGPPHKRAPLAGFSHRVAMLELALAGRNNISISLIEAERPTPSYTIETLHGLRERLGPHNYTLILGADSLLELHLWKQYEDILRLADLAVAARPGIADRTVLEAIDRLPGPYRSAGTYQYRRPDGRQIHYLHEVRIDLSSSTIRSLLAKGKRPEGLPDPVYDYILLNGLYRNDRDLRHARTAPGPDDP